MAALIAIVSWGLLPIYWKQLSSVSALEIISHRIVWSVIVTAGFLSFFRGWGQVSEALKNFKTLGVLLLSGCFIGCNWLLYIWAVNNGYVIQSSLGYYINPLVNVLFGVFIFHDRLRSVQWASIALAAAGVLYQIFLYGQVPLVALGLAGSFSMYGVLRKIVRVESLPGLFVETLFLSIPAMIFLLWKGMCGTGAFGTGALSIDLYLAGTGLVTSFPLLLFVQGARDLNLTTLGIVQYLSPTLQFLLGIYLFRETFTSSQMITFGIIWLAIVIYTAEGIYFRKK